MAQKYLISPEDLNLIEKNLKFKNTKQELLDKLELKLINWILNRLARKISDEKLPGIQEVLHELIQAMPEIEI